VSQATLRIVKVFWGLSAALAYKRHFPAVDWLVSYSLYADKMGDWYAENIGDEFLTLRAEAIKLLQESAGLEEIVRLVGVDSLSDRDKLTLETAKSLREDFLHQNAFHEVDTYASLEKQFKLLKLIMVYHSCALEALGRGVEFGFVIIPELRAKIGRAKYIAEADMKEINGIESEIKTRLAALTA
ncbi:MAG: V-type ATP synthase subunit A, partial [Christensenellaceae bacterium]|nr:V-type ATP synthase subunit A [Christensenellaceae bacterium]